MYPSGLTKFKDILTISVYYNRAIIDRSRRLGFLTAYKTLPLAHPSHSQHINGSGIGTVV